ncbi:hypothetical protein TBC1_111975 [Lentimicrobium saccharophilum]|uniref:Uncharacterized protein n=1 Tax=Lentimicrobium saccharophilum TaxID=1678841 RepID=A0A0S7C3Z0_9BACT|nr:hypothetical protein TBC1_111975 [Lentimicrobium saccharophilum]
MDFIKIQGPESPETDVTLLTFIPGFSIFIPLFSSLSRLIDTPATLRFTPEHIQLLKIC